jgi:enoyl-CoA hydratase/carnithine racemase
VARGGLKVLARMPEVHLGIIPGGGATQRLPRLIGAEPAARLLRTASEVSSEEALALGLVDRLDDTDPTGAAVTLARRLAADPRLRKAIPHGPIPCPAELPAVELGHLSRRIDAMLVEAIVRGAQGSLTDGLELEAQLSGRCIETEDARIGLSNFVQNGTRSAAAFIHR